MHFSKTEIRDLLKAWIVISIAFAIAMSGGFLGFGPQVLFTFVISALTVGTGFLLHEIMHKYFAQKYDCWAEFRANDMMLGLAVVMSFFGFIFAAPGGVYIKGQITKRKHGHIALAGPATNIVVGLAFMALAWLTQDPIKIIGMYGMQINFFLALFNLLPFFPFDGQKVVAWSKPIYVTSLIMAFVLTFFAGGLVA